MVRKTMINYVYYLVTKEKKCLLPK
jgi:hypothetical protein